MIGAVTRMMDRFLGRGDAAVTVPPLDGALQANRRLDAAGGRAVLPGVDSLASAGGGLWAAAGAAIWQWQGGWQLAHRLDQPVTAMAPWDGGLLLALADGNLRVMGGARDGWQAATGLGCITALAVDAEGILLTNGSAVHKVDSWQLDLLTHGRTGTVWRVAADGTRRQLAGGLAWPAGIAAGPDPVISEAWAHRLVTLSGRVLQSDLPGYPGRMAPGAEGWWLALFAPRSQLVEFVLREKAYRSRMMAEVPQEFWVAPRLRAGQSFYESLQGGGVKQLGLLKPWAPTMSAGILVRLDPGFAPRESLQSRADGRTHGVTAAVEHDGQLVIAARGDGVTLSIPLQEGRPA